MSTDFDVIMRTRGGACFDSYTGTRAVVAFFCVVQIITALHVLAGWYSGGLLSLLYTHLPDISQGTVAIRLRCGRSFSDEL